MKLITLLFAVCSVTTSIESIIAEENIQSNRFLEDAVIMQLFELLRLLIKEGSVNNNVPVLDPLQIDYLKINKDNDQFRIEAELSNITFYGLGDFELLDTMFNKDDVYLKLNITFPLLTLLSDNYIMNGNMYGIIPLFGRGLLHVEAHNLEFWSKVHLKQSDDGKSILIRDFSNAQYKIDRIVSQTQFDGNVDHVFNAIIEDLLAAYLSRFNKYVIAQHKHRMIQYFNYYLNWFESWRLIATIL